MVSEILPITVRPNSKGPKKNPMLQITIPISIRRKYNIQKGDTLLLLANENDIRIYTKDEYMRLLQ